MTIQRAISNIALPAFDHTKYFYTLAELGLSGIEIAPSRVWEQTWHGLSADQVSTYRKALEAAGLNAVGLHSLFFDQPHLGLFKNPEMRANSLEFLTHLSMVCRDLGGKTLVWGGGRKRGKVPLGEALMETVEFMGELAQRISDHGTVFCFEPLGPDSTDFINSALEAKAITDKVNHPALAIQLDAKALFQNNEVNADLFATVQDQLVHFHANEPDLGILGSSGEIDHTTMGGLLRMIGYEDYVSIEQRQLEKEPIKNIAKSVEIIKSSYG